MLKLKEIKLKIQLAQRRWSEIEGEVMENSLLSTEENVVTKKERLKNLLEDIRINIEDCLTYSHCRMLVKVCKEFLEKILIISEKLRVSYISPGYVESYYIFDTLRLTKHLSTC